MVSIIKFHELPVNDYIKESEKTIFQNGEPFRVVNVREAKKLELRDLTVKIILIIARVLTLNQSMRISSFKSQWDRLTSKTYWIDKISLENYLTRESLNNKNILRSEVIKAKVSFEMGMELINIMHKK